MTHRRIALRALASALEDRASLATRQACRAGNQASKARAMAHGTTSGARLVARLDARMWAWHERASRLRNAALDLRRRDERMHGAGVAPLVQHVQAATRAAVLRRWQYLP